MSDMYYERLTPLDAGFLVAENENAHLHVGSVSTFEAGPLRTPEGGIDFERIEKAMLVMLERNPRMRQKVWWPTGGPPVWIDDIDFRLSYHLRQTALPLPGTDRQLKRLAGRVMSQTLDSSKPLWEIWLVEGLSDDRFAVLAKLHHCLADGIRARNILTGYLGLEPTPTPDIVDTWRPRPAPSFARLRLDELKRRTSRSLELWRDARQYLEQQDLRESVGRVASGAAELITNLASEVSHTPLNRRIGPHRRFDWLACEFDDVRRIRKASGAKVNDVVLACVTGAMRRFLLARKLHVDELDFRIMVPVNVRGDDEQNAGNRVSAMTVPVPLFETDPWRRLKRIVSTTSRIKASSQSQIGNWLAELADLAGVFVPGGLAQRAASRLASNLVVTNVPGPLFPMYLLESRLLESFPLVPLYQHQALGIALYTYDRKLHWGLNADWDVVPDLHDIADAIADEFDRLLHASEPTEIRPAAERTATAARAALPTRDATATGAESPAAGTRPEAPPRGAEHASEKKRTAPRRAAAQKTTPASEHTGDRESGRTRKPRRTRPKESAPSADQV